MAGIIKKSSEGETITRIEDIPSLRTTYYGRAKIGSIASDAVWQIRKVQIVRDTNTGIDDITILWAEGNKNYDKAWTDRATFTYS